MSSSPCISSLVYAAPATEAEPHAVDDLVERTRPTSLVITAAGVVALTGTVLALAALQLWMNFTLLGMFRAIAWGMVALGIVHLAIAVKIFRLRLWAAYAGFALGIVSSLAAVAWFLLSTASGLFTLYGVMLPIVGAAGAVLSFLAVAPARAATDARRRLIGDGIETDF